MTRRKNSLKSLVMGLLLAFVCPVCAQVTGSKVFPLHVEASFESGTSYHKMMPMDFSRYQKQLLPDAH